MSPGPARGESVDARSDIFSFGAVLYEMATGQRAFAGTSSAETLALPGPPTPDRSPPVDPDQGEAIEPSSCTGSSTNGFVPPNGYRASTRSSTSMPSPGLSGSG
jgi:serine/threonine protein kinase